MYVFTQSGVKRTTQSYWYIVNDFGAHNKVWGN